VSIVLDIPVLEIGVPEIGVPDAASAERAFVARLKSGDDAAYEELVRTRGGQMLAVARRLLRDEDAARDAVQDAFLSAFRAIQRFDGHSQLSTWLHRIVVNAALMRLRSRHRRPEQSIEPMLPRFAEDGHHAEPVLSWAESGACQLETEQTQALVRAGIDELPDGYRTVLVMRDIEELSTREAADLLGATENAVKLRLHRARQALAVIIKQRLAGSAAPRQTATAPAASAAAVSTTAASTTTASATTASTTAASATAASATAASATAASATAASATAASATAASATAASATAASATAAQARPAAGLAEGAGSARFTVPPPAAATWTGPFAAPASPLAMPLGA
jgi:RNA polymerase sigma-70 factor (ECF subfamily)